MNEALEYNRLASRLYRSIRAVERDTSEYDDATAEVLGLILEAFAEVGNITAGTPTASVVGDTGEDDDDQIN